MNGPATPFPHPGPSDGEEIMEHPTAIGMTSRWENAVRKHLEEVAWGLLLVLTGIIWIVPGIPVPFGAWLVGTGIILVGGNAVRYAVDRRFETFSLTLGIVALVAGTSEFIAVDLPILGLCFLAFGVVLLLQPLRRKRASRQAAA